MNLNTVDDLLSLSKALAELQAEFVAVTSEKRAAEYAATCLAMANTYITELVRHLAQRKTRDDAIQDTLLGAMVLVKKQIPKLQLIQGGLDPVKK